MSQTVVMPPEAKLFAVVPTLRNSTCRQFVCFISHLISAEAGLQVSAGQVADAHPLTC